VAQLAEQSTNDPRLKGSNQSTHASKEKESAVIVKLVYTIMILLIYTSMKHSLLQIQINKRLHFTL